MKEIIRIGKCFENGKNSLVLVIPKELRERLKIERGNKFAVKLDSKNRIIYDPVTKPVIAPKGVLSK